MTNMQNYMEDIHDSLEDLNLEMDKRFKRLLKWDLQISACNDKSKKLESFVLDQSKPKNERKRKMIKLAEVRNEMRELSERKIALCEKNLLIIQSINFKLSELAYNCKCEVEIDSPGCTEIREKLFSQSIEFAKNSHANETKDLSEFSRDGNNKMALMADDDMSSSMNVIPILKEKRRVGRPRNVMKESSMYSKGTSFTHNLDRDSEKTGKKMKSTYLKTNYEVEEQHHSNETNIKKTKHYNLNVLKSKIKEEEKEEEDTPCEAENNETKDHPNTEDDDLLDFISIAGKLPSPPREIMETLNVSNSGIFPNDNNLSRPNKDKTSSEGFDKTAEHSTKPLKNPTVLKRKKTSSHSISSSSMYESEKRKRLPLFVADKSFSGRTIKLTERATESVKSTKEIEGHRKIKQQNDDWCICDGIVTSDMMIECDNKKCKIGWFHFECVGLVQSPIGKWFCPSCQKISIQPMSVESQKIE